MATNSRSAAALISVEVVIRLVVAGGFGLTGFHIFQNICRDPLGDPGGLCDDSGFPRVFAVPLGILVVYNLIMAFRIAQPHRYLRPTMIAISGLAVGRTVWVVVLAWGLSSAPSWLVAFGAVCFGVALLWIALTAATERSEEEPKFG